MNVEDKTFTFLVSWGLWLIVLSVFSKTRLGYVLLYYSLALMILFVLVSEYKQLMPYLRGIVGVSEFNNPLDSTVPVSSTSTTTNGIPAPNGDGTNIFPTS